MTEEEISRFSRLSMMTERTARVDAAICSCMRCKAERYNSISKFNYHRAKVIERMRKALQDIAAIEDNYEIEKARKIANDALDVVGTPGKP
jgi:hypothetical protein